MATSHDTTFGGAYKDDNTQREIPSSQSRYERRLDRILDHVVLPEESKVTACLQAFLRSRSSTKELDEANDTQHQQISLSKIVMDVIHEFSTIESSTKKRAGRRALEEAARQLLVQAPTEECEGSSALISASLVAITLAFYHHTSRPEHRSIASAIGAALTRDSKGQELLGSAKDNDAIVHALFRSLFQEAISKDNQSCLNESTGTDWHVISGLAKALQVDCLHDDAMAKTAAQVISEMLNLDRFKSDDSSLDLADQVSRADATDPLALAAQLQPWQVLEPTELINVAIGLDLWHAAERICDSATSSTAGTEASDASVEALLEGSFQSKQYRQADNFATQFFQVGGKRWFLEARYLHACATIVKVIRKGALPVVDRQIDRVDRAAKKMEKDGTIDYLNDTVSAIVAPENAGRRIRSFALEQLEETGNADAAHRLASLWGMDYAYDEEAILRATKARREKYLQWEDLLPGSPPDLISIPEDLIAAMSHLQSKQSGGIYGFDAEWSENNAGVDLLQVASLKSVALIDIPALSKTPEGVDALANTVGLMFASCTMVGFACRQDISKLRGSPTCYKKDKDKKHWLRESDGVVDLQSIVTMSDQSLSRFGLSRVCERFLGKPLDKSEQCSLWNIRPLSLRQRTYAALDAWTVRAVYDQLVAVPTTDSKS